MTYSRMFYGTSVNLNTVTVRDTAENIGTSFTPVIRVDTVPPKVTAVKTGPTNSTTVTLTVSDPVE